MLPQSSYKLRIQGFCGIVSSESNSSLNCIFRTTHDKYLQYGLFLHHTPSCQVARLKRLPLSALILDTEISPRRRRLACGFFKSLYAC